jgi:ankyrin repeat protein
MRNLESRTERLERKAKVREQFKELEEHSLFKTTPLIDAITNGDHEEVRRLLDSGADVNEQGTGFMKTSPLISAVTLAGLPPEAEAMRTMMAGKLPDIGAGLLSDSMRIGQDLETKPGEAMKKMAGMLPSASEFRAQLKQRRNQRRKDVDDGAIPESSPLRDEHAAVTRILLAHGANLEERDESGQTALAHAASAGQPKLVRMLLDAGALIEAEDNGGKTPLMLAAGGCEPETVRLLLQLGADVHARSRRGGTALISAANGSSRRVVQLLLDAGADVNARSEDGSTPLLAAAMQVHAEIVEQLRSAGAETGFLEALALGDDEVVSRLMPEPGSQQPEWGRSVLTRASRAGRADILRTLHRCGTSPDAADANGNSPLFRAVMSGDLETVRALLDGGANPNPQPSRFGSMSPLDWAVSMGTPDMVRLLVDRGASVNNMDLHGRTPLHGAAMKGNVEAARILLEAGADPNLSGEEHSNSPLGFAATMGNTDMARLLLEHGAKPSCSASKDIPADVLPGVKENPELLGILHAADGTDLHDAAKDGDLGRITSLLDGGRSIEGRDRLDHTPLHKAAKAGHAEAVRLLLDRGANPSAESMFRITPLLLAVNKGHIDIAQVLLESGADPDMVMDLGATPLIAATRLKDAACRTEIVDLLLSHGAKVHIQEAAALGDLDTVRSLVDIGILPDDANESGATALMTAAGTGQVEIVEALLRRGATVDLADSRGFAAVTWAMSGGHVEVGNRLLAAGANPNGPPADRCESAHFITPLQAAVAQGRIELVEFLLDRSKPEWAAGGQVRVCAFHNAASGCGRTGTH